MNDEPALFGDEPTDPGPTGPPRAPAVSDWQVGLLRKALDARGLTTMEERQLAIGSAAGRPVESLRALTQEEALHVLSMLGRQPAKGPSGRSAWDDRDEDTWIDGL